MKRTATWTLILLSATLILLVACDANENDPGSATGGGEVIGDATRGERLYKQTTIGAASAPGCITCHSLEPGVQLVGPSHAGLAFRAKTAVPGKSAEEFLRESIVDPGAFAPEGFVSGLMYENYGTDLSEQEIADLVEFLLTLT